MDARAGAAPTAARGADLLPIAAARQCRGAVLVARALQHAEPVLVCVRGGGGGGGGRASNARGAQLVGETGTGKTTLAGRSAASWRAAR